MTEDHDPGLAELEGRDCRCQECRWVRQEAFVGPKRGGKYRHVRPSGVRVDNFTSWFCRMCWACRVEVAEPSRPHRCYGHLPGRSCFGQPLERLLPVLDELQIPHDVAHAAIRVGYWQALGDLILEAEQRRAQAEAGARELPGP